MLQCPCVFAECGACQFSLGNDTVDVQEDWAKKWNETQKVGAVQSTDPTLQVCVFIFLKYCYRHSLSDDLYLPL